MWHNPTMPEEDVNWLLKNEYASVKVTVDTEGKGTRLKVEDLSSGTSIYLDPIELQALAWATKEDLSVFTRPYFKERALERKMGITPPDAAVDEAESIARDEQAE
jgi:hypothetical protein